MDEIASFGEWVRRQRKALDLTQADLARRVGCSTIAIRKIEAGERRPSAQVAKLLAAALQIPVEEQPLFLRVALGKQRVDWLPAPAVESAFPAARAAASLPMPLTPLIGRQTATAQLHALLQRETVRLVTLTGPGGIGKTRLALQVAADLQDHFKDGVYFVSLAPLREPALLVPTLALHLNIRELPGDRSPVEQLIAALRNRHLLLVLDNFEHLVSAAPVLTALRSACAQLHLLVTSREALHLQGEQEYPVPPLTLLDPASTLTPTAAWQAEAVQLFVQRAQAVQPDFTLTTDNVATILQICTRLDGLPLAIELAAARLKLLPPTALFEQIASVVGARFTILKSGARDAPARHQTLYQAIEWSNNLLTPPEQALLRRLAIFVGGWTLAAAAAICAFEVSSSESTLPVQSAEGQTLLDGLASLVDKSLVRQVASEPGEARFSLLETVREFGLTQLAQHHELATMQRTHALYFIALSERAQAEFDGPDRLNWFERLATETGNLHAAHEWIIANAETALGLRLGTALWPYWDGHRRKNDGRQKLAAVVKLPGADRHPRALATVLIGAGHLAEATCDYPQACALLEAALALTRTVDDQSLMMDALNALGLVMRAQGEYERAQHYYEQSLALARSLEDNSLVAQSLDLLGIIAHLQSRHDLAESIFQEGLSLASASGDALTASDILFDRSSMALSCGDVAVARTLLDQSKSRLSAVNINYGRYHCEPIVVGLLSLGEHDAATARRQVQQALRASAADDQFWTIALCFESLAIVAAAQDQVGRAFTLAGAAAALRRATRSATYSYIAAQLGEALAGLSAKYGAAFAAIAQTTGERMTFEDAVAYACEG